MNRQRLSLLFAILLVFGSSSLLMAKGAEESSFTRKDKAFYLDETQQTVLRPGLVLEILDVTIPADRIPEVWFTLKDPAGLPLDRNGIFTPGPVSTSFVLSYIPDGGESYVAYTTRIQTSPITGESAEQGTSDQDGTYTEMAIGEYIYKFGTQLPSDYDQDVTHTLGIYARRDLREFDLDRYVANELDHFVPSGASEPQPRDVVTTETCNGRCHDPLEMHGGSRQEIGLCVLCHNSTQDIDPDTGNSVDFPLMIHKIHYGENLTNGYTIIGFRQSVHDYSDVVYPGDILDCEGCHTGGVPTEDFPLVANPADVISCKRRGKGSSTLSWDADGRVELRSQSPDGKRLARSDGPGSWTPKGNSIKDGMEFFLVDSATGETIDSLTMNTTIFGCVGEAPGSFRGEPGVAHTNWKTRPTRAACGSCHDHVNFATGEGHSPFELEQGDDSQCSICHGPVGEEFDRSVPGAHTVPYQSKQLGGVLVQIDKVRNAAPGRFPSVIFWLSNRHGPLNPNELGRLRFAIAGANEDFDIYLDEDALGKLTRVARAKYRYDFENPIPSDAEGSFTIGAEGRINSVLINPGTDDEFSLRDQMQNQAVAFAVTDEEAVARREIVSDEKCESCHQNLSFHGGNRHEPQYCVTCHQPFASDIDERTEENLPPQTVHFKYMIHKIHRGTELENGYTVLGFRGSVNDFSHVEFPGDLRNCDACHVNNSQQLPLPDGVLPTPTPYDFLEIMQPMTSACLSCHDSFEASAHAVANSGELGETCSTCHGEGRSYSVDAVHAR